jgi:LmbE family N-acetylglucosaminyl deacetylase
MSARVLVIAAHPDDEVLGAGGTLARHVRAGEEVVVLILGEGVTSRFPTREEAPAADLDRLRADARRANARLGVKDVRFGGLPDNRFDGLELLDVVAVVEKVIQEVAPEVLYTHHPGDLNVDHQITFRAVLTATRPLPGAAVREVCCFEVPSSTEWSFARVGPAFVPNLFVDITETLDQKVAALECYTGEVRPAPHPRSPEVLRAAAVRWGSVVGRSAAEPFEIVRSLR